MIDGTSKFALQRVSNSNQKVERKGTVPTPFQKCTSSFVFWLIHLVFFTRPEEDSANNLKFVNNETVPLGFHIHPESNWKILYEAIHTIIIIYTIFAVPIYVNFS